MADFTLSPGIVTNEIDKSIRPEKLMLSSIAGVVGRFNWGPSMIPTLITSENEFIKQFGKPVNNNYVEWFNVYNFLQYGKTANVVRVVDNDSARNACFGYNTYGQQVLIYNDANYAESLILKEGGLKDPSDAGIKFGQDTQYGAWIARYPGDLGNSIKVDMCFADSPEEKMPVNDIGAEVLNEVYFQKIAGNKYYVKFQHTSMGSTNHYPLFGSGSNIWIGDYAIESEQKVVSFTCAGSSAGTYNLLITGFDPALGHIAYVNRDAYGDVPTVDNMGVHELTIAEVITDITIRERSKFKEFSYGARRNSPNNLMGRVFFDNNTDRIYGKNTVFSEQVVLGDILIITGQRVVVSEIISNTEIRIDRPIVGKVESNNPTFWSREWKYAQLYPNAPATSNNARVINQNMNGHYCDEVHVTVIDDGGEVTGNVGQVLESYASLSVARDGRDDFGAPTYYVTRVNNTSEWVKWAAHPLDGKMDNNWGEMTAGGRFVTYHTTKNISDYTAQRFAGGDGGNPTQEDDILRAVELFKSKEDVEVDFLVTGWTYVPGHFIDYRIAISKMIQIAEERKDCVVCVSGDYGQIASGFSDEKLITDRMVNWRDGVYNSSYAFMDGNFKYQYDSFNDTYRWLPLSGDIAGLMAQTDINYYPWYSPAGYNRGQIKNVVKLSFNPSQEARDEQYLNQVNPVITIRGEGTLLFGDKTMTKVASAFDRINVRRLFITVKDFVVFQARRKLFEFNTPSTRAEFTRQIENYLEKIVQQQGCSEYRIVCDETNNTNELIEENKFVADIYIRPTYVINFIKLNFTAVGQTVDFKDLGLD
jgi:hypothetical protein